MHVARAGTKKASNRCAAPQVLPKLTDEVAARMDAIVGGAYD